MHEPVETTELLAFSRTVEARSLSRAATELAIPRATLSRRLARLEERLGARLLRRTTRSLVVTDAGEALYRHAKLALEAIERAEASVRQTEGTIRGELRISAPPGFGTMFSAFVCDFAARYPELRVQIHFASRHVDLRRDGYDVAIRATPALEPGLIARKLASDRALAVASPAYLAKHGTPRTRRDLAKHRCLTTFTRGELPQMQWPLAKGGSVAIEAAFSSNDIELLTLAALRGHGVALLPGMLARPFIEAGDLVHVLAGVIESHAQVAIVYLERELMPPQVRAFVDELVAWAPKGFAATLAARVTSLGGMH
ncbi:MAG TPA: LysR family transcriptional regulator [Kofleriaceae bacterium]|nr:LysR family transcriptional regulator [Kofleriaceae bacterium]